MALIAHTWMNIVLPLIGCECEDFGSGFLVFRETSESRGRLFIVTAKHVLFGKDKNGRPKTQPDSDRKISLFMPNNGVDPNSLTISDVSIEQTNTPVTCQLHPSSYRTHPDENVDLAALEITELKHQYPQVSTKGISYPYFATNDKLSKLDLTAGEDVYILSYPNVNNRKDNGALAPLIQDDLCLPTIKSGTVATRTGHKDKGFYVDCLVTPGSSGGPVFSKRPFHLELIDDLSDAQGTATPFLLGLITNQEFIDAPTKGNTQSWVDAYAGLAWAFDANAIQETVEQFFSTSRVQ